MGSVCGKGNACAYARRHTEEDEEKDISFPPPGTYKSTMDGYFSKIENQWNILKYFQLNEFTQLLIYFSIQPKTEVDRVKQITHEMSTEEFSVFLENKIVKNFLISSLINEDEERILLFKEFAKNVFDSVLEAQKDLFRKKNPTVKLKKGQIKFVKKAYILPLAILLCNSTNTAKVDMLFNLFVNQSREFTKCEELDNFLFFLFITPSTCSFRALKNIAGKFPNKIDQISVEDYTQKTDAFEVDDIIRLKDLFLADFFKGSDSITKNEFEEKFRNGNFGWIFSPNGIRFNLEKCNDVKPPQI